MIPEPFRVVDRHREAPDTVTLALEPLDGPAPTPRPGQFAMLWPFGVGEAAISYSRIADGLTHHTVRAVGATTAALCELAVGDVVGCRGPFGRGWDLSGRADRSTVVVAGGLGLSPLRPAVDALASMPGRVHLLVGAREPDQLIHRDDLRGWTEAGVDVRITVDHATEDWSGPVGVVTALLDRVPLDAETSALVCGPELMMRYTAADLVAAGVRPERVQVSLERNMHCGIGHCGHCQIGPVFVCCEGPVVPWDRVAGLVAVADR